MSVTNLLALFFFDTLAYVKAFTYFACNYINYRTNMSKVIVNISTNVKEDVRSKLTEFINNNFSESEVEVKHEDGGAEFTFKYSARDVCELTGISRTRLSQYINGRKDFKGKSDIIKFEQHPLLLEGIDYVVSVNERNSSSAWFSDSAIKKIAPPKP